MLAPTIGCMPLLIRPLSSWKRPLREYTPIPQTRHLNALVVHQLATQLISRVWLSGQIPADAQGNLITGSVAEKTQAIIRNTEAILEEAGSSLDRVVKVVVYVKDASIMPEFSKVYDPAFPHKPTQSMAVFKLPAGVDIQVDFVAVV